MSTNSQVSTLEQPGLGRRAAASAPAASVKPKNNGHDVALSGKNVEITIHPNDGPGGDEPVPVGLNGYVYQIPRATPSLVPVEVYDILKNAVTQIVSTDPTGAQLVRDVPRYAYTVGLAEV